MKTTNSYVYNQVKNHTENGGSNNFTMICLYPDGGQSLFKAAISGKYAFSREEARHHLLEHAKSNIDTFIHEFY